LSDHFSFLLYLRHFLLLLIFDFLFNCIYILVFCFAQAPPPIRACWLFLNVHIPYRGLILHHIKVILSSPTLLTLALSPFIQKLWLIHLSYWSKITLTKPLLFLIWFSCKFSRRLLVVGINSCSSLLYLYFRAKIIMHFIWLLKGEIGNLFLRSCFVERLALLILRHVIRLNTIIMLIVFLLLLNSLLIRLIVVYSLLWWNKLII
jgi:hypothetical protein